ncbi:MAG: hypothetical protein ACE5NN_03575 [Candidatus Bathyarchaeia archaeon]
MDSYEEYVERRHKEALMRKPKRKLVEIIIQLEEEVERLGGDLEQINYD